MDSLESSLNAIKGFFHTPSLSEKNIDSANYIWFQTEVVDDLMMVEVFYTKPSYLYVKRGSEYETWKRYNGGIRYYVALENDTIEILHKRLISFD